MGAQGLRGGGVEPAGGEDCGGARRHAVAGIDAGSVQGRFARGVPIDQCLGGRAANRLGDIETAGGGGMVGGQGRQFRAGSDGLAAEAQSQGAEQGRPARDAGEQQHGQRAGQHGSACNLRLVQGGKTEASSQRC